MQRKITYLALTLLLLWGAFLSQPLLNASSTPPVDSTVPTSGYNNPLSVDAFDFNKLDGTSLSGNLSPNQSYHASITVSDADTIEDVQSLSLVLHYAEKTADESFEDAMDVNATLNDGAYAIFTWQRANTSGSALTDFEINYDGTYAVSHSALEWEVLSSTTPAITDASGNTEGSISYTFELTFRVSKVARFSNDHRWYMGTHIIDGMIDNGSGLVTTTHSALSVSNTTPITPPTQGLNMDWYGEIEVAPGERVDWVDANPLDPFTSALTTFSGITYISNGYFDYDVFPSDVWDAEQTLPTGVTYASLVEKEPSELENQTQELAIKVADVNNLAESVLLKPSRLSNAQEMRIGSDVRTLESGTGKTIHFWVALSEVFQNANYSGSLTFVVHNNLDPIRDMSTNDSYATLAEAAAAGVSDVQIMRPHSETVTLTSPMNIDFNGFTLTGNLGFTTSASGTMTLSAIGTIDGDLTINAENLTVVNQVDVTGTTTIDAISQTSFISNALHTGGIKVQGAGRLELSNQAALATVTVDTTQTVSLDGSIASVIVTGSAADITVSGTVNQLTNAITGSTIDVTGTVRDLLAHTDMNLTLNGTLSAIEALGTVSLDRVSGSNLGTLSSSGNGRFDITGDTNTLDVPISALKANGEMISFASPVTPTSLTFNGSDVLALVTSNAGIYQFTPSSLLRNNTLVVEATNYQTLTKAFTPNAYNPSTSKGYFDINAAIADAAAGDRLYIEATTHDLDAPIVINKSIILEGNINQPSSVILNAPTHLTDHDVIQVIASNVTIQGFTIQGARDLDGSANGRRNAGILLGGDPLLLANKPAESIEFSLNAPNDWWAHGVSHVAIRHNIITDNSYGIFAFHTQDLLIEHNTIFANAYNGDESGTWSGKGVQIYSSQDFADSNLVVNSEAGLQVTHDVLIQHNQIYENELFGIELNHSESYHGGDVGPMDVNVRIINNDIYNNGSEDNYPWGGPLDFYRGISTNGNDKNITISANAIYGHLTSTGDQFAATSAGIRIYNSSEVAIQNNIIEDNTRGIMAYGGAENIDVGAGNVIRDNAQGIVFQSSSTGTVASEITYARNDLTRYQSKGLAPANFITLE